MIAVREERRGGGRAEISAPAALREAVAARLLEDDAVIAGTADRAVLRGAIARALAAEGVVVSPTRWAQLVRDLVDDLGGLGPLEALLRDPGVTDVMVNGPDEIWLDRGGRLERTDAAFRDDDHVREVVGRVLAQQGARWDRTHPWVDAVLPGGIRVHALLPPLAPHPTVTLRRVAAVVPSWEELASSGSVPPQARAILAGAVAERRNLVVSGRAGVGKTTLLGRLLEEVGDDRLVVIEDAPELACDGLHAVMLRVRPPSPDGTGAVDVATLVRNALRMRPDRLVVGEVRGAEVADLLQAMNTGHAGSMTTVHANGADDALVRLHGMALLAGVPEAAATAQLRTAVDVLVHCGRAADGGRFVAEVVALTDDGTTRPLWTVNR